MRPQTEKDMMLGPFKLAQKRNQLTGLATVSPWTKPYQQQSRVFIVIAITYVLELLCDWELLSSSGDVIAGIPSKDDDGTRLNRNWRQKGSTECNVLMNYLSYRYHTAARNYQVYYLNVIHQ